MKNILFVTPTTTFDNGAEISIFYLMKYLVSQGYNVFSVCQEIPEPLLSGGGRMHLVASQVPRLIA